MHNEGERIFKQLTNVFELKGKLKFCFFILFSNSVSVKNKNKISQDLRQPQSCS